MKIVCDACQAKYSIADDKIQGKAFKIRCKKCNHIIVVKNTGDSAAAASASAEKQKVAAAPAAAAPAAASSAEQGGWHVVVDGEQVGPLTEAEVKDKLRASQINADTLVWKEGFADWTALSSVPELVALQSKTRPSGGRAAVHEPAHPAVSAKAAAPTTASPDPGDVFAAATVITPAAADPFAAGAAAAAAAQVTPVVQAIPNPVAPAPSSPFLFGGAQAQPAEPAIVIKNPTTGPGGTHLTGQRNENSVLFSLSNLEALAVPSGASPGIRPPSSSSNTEGSGLIDIRSMAAMTLNDGGDARHPSEALPTFSTPQFSPVAPVLLPISSSGPPKWVYPVLGLLAVGILVLGYAIYRVMSSPAPGNPIVVMPAPAPVAPPPVAAPAPVPTAPTAAPAAAAEPAKAVVEEKPAAAAEEKPVEKSGKGSKGEKRHKGEGSASKGVKKGSETVASGDKGKSGDKDKKAVKDIGAALGDFGKKEEPPKPAPAQPKLVTLTQSDIVNAMKAVQPKVQACANQYKVPGTAMATIAVAAGGKVSSATVTGKFTGTPTGDCVAGAAKSAKFPACQAMTFPWPFTLSPR